MLRLPPAAVLPVAAERSQPPTAVAVESPPVAAQPVQQVAQSLAAAPAPSQGIVERWNGRRKDDTGGTSQAAASGCEYFAWLDLPPSSALVLEGLPARGPLVPHNKSRKVFSCAHGLLQELIDGFISDEVTFEHDPSCEKYPDIKAAVETTFGQAISFCVAKCAKLGRWGIGTAWGHKPRETSAKLALAISYMYDLGMLEQAAHSEPDFREFCVDAGLMTQEGLPTSSSSSNGLKYPVLGLALNTISSLTEAGMAPQAPAVIYDKEFEAFQIGSPLLYDLVGDGSKTISFEHDPDFDKFPEVRLAIAEAQGVGEEDAFCVAKCAACNAWAVGIASGWKNREKAARIALALALADDQEVFDKAIWKYKEFADLCTAAGLITKDQVPKKRKWDKWTDDREQKKGKWQDWSSDGGQGSWNGGGAWQGDSSNMYGAMMGMMMGNMMAKMMGGKGST